MVRHAVAWLKNVQQHRRLGRELRQLRRPDTGRRRRADRVADRVGMLGLIAAGEAHSDAVKRGIDCLHSTQKADGTWHEEPFTGTGFPKVFYLKYHLYALYFPLMALARYATSEFEHAFSAESDLTMAGYIVKKKLTRKKRFPLVLMLEPLHACNLTCTGCGRIREYETTIKQKLTVEECLRLGRRVRRADRVDLRRRADDLSADRRAGRADHPQAQAHLPLHQRHVHRKRLHEFRPTSRFFFNVHLDGLEKTHDLAVEREGVFRPAVEGIKAAKEAGFLVCTNTTIYKETDIAEIDDCSPT